MIHRLATAAVAIGLLSTALPARAAAPAETRQVDVGFRDLDLSQESGVATLDRRVRHAARQVCGNIDMRDLAQTIRVDSCRKAAIAGAAPQIQLAVAAARSGADYAANEVRVGRAATPRDR